MKLNSNAGVSVAEKTLRHAREVFRQNAPTSGVERVCVCESLTTCQIGGCVRKRAAGVALPADPLERCKQIRERVAEMEAEVKRLTEEHNALLGTGTVDADDIAWATGLLTDATKEPVAWMSADGERTVPASAKATADREGGASASAMRAYPIPLFAHPPAQAKSNEKEESVAALPKGWIAVPIEPTRKMINAGGSTAFMDPTGAWILDPAYVYSAMLAALPHPRENSMAETPDKESK